MGAKEDLIALQQGASYAAAREPCRRCGSFDHDIWSCPARTQRAIGRGGWVAPLQPNQFAGSPQADTQTGGDTGGGDGGGSV